MKRRRSAGDERRAQQKRTSLLQIALVIGVVVVAATAYYQASSGLRELDDVTSCPASPDSVTVLLVDVTDPMNVAQRQDFFNKLEALKNSIPRYGKLSVVQVDSTSEDLLRPVITRCNPGTADELSEVNADPVAVQRQHDTNFDAPLDAAFRSLAHATGAERSPIQESIQSVALTELAPTAAHDRPRRLVVVSDLLQNTDRISFYGRLPDAAQFIASPAFRTVRTDLRGVDVELWMLQRPDAGETQPRALADLWAEIIAAQGGNITSIYNVSG